MRPFSESAFQEAGESPSFLSRLGIAVVLWTAGMGVALALAAA